MIEYLTSIDFLMVMIKIVIIFGGVMGALAYLTWLERKVMARVQMRPGPTRVGPFGLLQPAADGIPVRRGDNHHLQRSPKRIWLRRLSSSSGAHKCEAAYEAAKGIEFGHE